MIRCQTPSAWSISSTWSMSSSRPSRLPLRAVDGDRVLVVASAHLSVERYVPPVRRRVSRKSSKIRVAAVVHLRDRHGAVDRPDRVLGDHLEERARVAAAERVEDAADPPASAFKRRERQAVALELRVVELGELAMARPDDRLAGRVDLVRERHALGRSRRRGSSARARTRRPRTCCGCRSGRSRARRRRCPSPTRCARVPSAV